MTCRAIWAIVNKDRLTLKRIPIRIVYRKGEEIGVSITGILKPTLNLTFPLNFASVSSQELAEALCCATRGSTLEVAFNVATALALIIGSATGITEAIAIGLAGMTITLVQEVIKLFKSRKGCMASLQARIVASTILRLVTGAVRTAVNCSDTCTKLITYGGQVYRILKFSREDRIEIILKPL